MARLTKKQKQIQELVGDQSFFAPKEAVELVKKASLAKFDETVEVAFCLGINPKHADQQVRSTVSLPEGTGQVEKTGTLVTISVRWNDNRGRIKAANDADASTETFVYRTEI